jgi:hypothetical protein
VTAPVASTLRPALFSVDIARAAPLPLQLAGAPTPEPGPWQAMINATTFREALDVAVAVAAGHGRRITTFVTEGAGTWRYVEGPHAEVVWHVRGSIRVAGITWGPTSFDVRIATPALPLRVPSSVVGLDVVVAEESSANWWRARWNVAAASHHTEASLPSDDDERIGLLWRRSMRIARHCERAKHRHLRALNAIAAARMVAR